MSTSSQLRELRVPDGASGDYFGASVGLSDDGAALVGAPEDDVGANPDQGSAYVFATGASASATPTSMLVAPDGAPADNFGYAVALSGDTAVVGAPGHAVGNSPVQGAAYVFVRENTGWVLQGEPLIASDGEPADAFGTAVAIAGDTIVVGAPFHAVEGNMGQGAAYVFARSGGSWVAQGATLVAENGRAGEAFGSYVALFGDTALIGAPIRQVGHNEYQGAGYVFVRNGASWSQQGAELVAPDGGPFDQLGPCALAQDTALLGAPYHTVGSQPVQGAAYVFTRTGEDWTIQGPALTAADGESGDQFGNAVALHGERALIAGWGHQRAENEYRGGAYLFARSGAVWTRQGPVLLAGGGASSEVFGASVALSSEHALIGAPTHRVADDLQQGSAYLFALNASEDADGCACRAAPTHTRGALPSFLLVGVLASVLAFNRRRRSRAAARRRS